MDTVQPKIDGSISDSAHRPSGNPTAAPASRRNASRRCPTAQALRRLGNGPQNSTTVKNTSAANGSSTDDAAGMMIMAEPKPVKPRTSPAAMIAKANHHSPGNARAAVIKSGIYVGILVAGGVVRLVPVPLDAQPQQNGRGHKDRGISPHNHAPDHRKDKATDHITAQHIKRNQRQQGGDRGHHRARQRLVDRDVQHLRQRLFLVLAQVLAHPVKDNHRIVQTIANDGQQSRDNGQIKLDLKL
mmetsp:Transcript_22933/g.38570  ORF Transcript_22933/g.38570 Transcript_22933/m.38570 type:complete len:243 (+) Transcript_22933:2829-3557(+)